MRALNFSPRSQNLWGDSVKLRATHWACSVASTVTTDGKLLFLVILKYNRGYPKTRIAKTPIWRVICIGSILRRLKFTWSKTASSWFIFNYCRAGVKFKGTSLYISLATCSFYWWETTIVHVYFIGLLKHLTHVYNFCMMGVFEKFDEVQYGLHFMSMLQTRCIALKRASSVLTIFSCHVVSETCCPIFWKFKLNIYNFHKLNL